MPGDPSTELRRAIAADAEMSPIEIVLVCTGNRARSPLAAALLSRRAAGGLVRVQSCGILDTGSAPALPEIVRVGKSLGVDLTHHRSSVLVNGALADASLVLGFEPLHTATAILDGGARPEVVFTLPEIISLLDPPRPRGRALRLHIDELVESSNARRRGDDPWHAPSIDDPVGRRRRTFDRIAREIDSAIELLSAVLLAAPARPDVLDRD